MKKLKLLQGGGIFLALVLLVWQMIPSEKNETTQRQALVPEWFGVDVAVTEMDELGQPKRSFSAARLTHYTEQNMTDMLKPSFTLIPESKIPWRLTAAKGRSFHGGHTTDIERIDLWTDVVVWQPKEATPRPMRMNTSTLSVFPDDALALTDQPVALDQPGHTITGKGMRANFNEKTMELLDNVRSEHVRPPNT